MTATTQQPSGTPALPGEILFGEGDIEINAAACGRAEMEIVNTGDRPVQVGSHVHLPQANPALSVDRVAAHGLRFDDPRWWQPTPSTEPMWSQPSTPRARCGCGSAFRSAEPVNDKASGQARCAPTSTANRCCGTGSR